MAMAFSFLMIFFFLLDQNSTAQVNRVWGRFGQKVNVTPFAKKDFQLEAAIKVALSDSAGSAGIYASFVDKKNKHLMLYEMKNGLADQNTWHTYTLKGIIPRKAKYMYVGGYHTNMGVYFYDDFKLFLPSNKKRPDTIFLSNASFETDSLLKTWYHAYQPGLWFTQYISNEESFTGDKSLKVDGTEKRRLIQYGKNDSAGKYIWANGIKMYYETYGKGEPLILLHGNDQYIGVFSQQIFEFSKYYQVIAVDTRGHGKSTEDGKKYSYDLFAEDINAFMDSLKITKATLVGWSDGGNTSLIMAMKYPEKVRSLVAMGSNIFIDKSVVRKSVFRMLHKGVRFFGRDTSYVSKNKVRLFELLLTEPMYRFEDLKKILCPVLIIAGEKDIMKEDHTKKIASAIKNSNFFIAPGETHFFPRESAKSFNMLVLDFMKKQN